MSEAFRLLVRLPFGTLLIGGRAPVPDEMHAAHATRDGQPLLPSTSIRGALRETLEALLRATGVPVCRGGHGIADSEDAPRGSECRLDAGRPCRACRLFGGARARLPAGERLFSALVLGDALPVNATRQIRWSGRDGVAIDRASGSASNRRYYRRRTPEEQLEFAAEGRLACADATQRADLIAAVSATSHIGSGRSSGLGRIELAIEWLAPAIAEVARALPGSGDVEIEVTLEAPAAFGVPLARGNHRETRTHIPGSAVRGAIGFALAEALPDPKDGDFQRLVASDGHGAIFDFLYRAERPTISGIGGPWPITARACRSRSHPRVVDRLIDSLAIGEIRDAETAGRLSRELDGRCAIEGCGEMMRAPTTERWADARLDIDVVTRVSLDRETSSARHGALFSYAHIPPGTRFVGRIRNVPAASRPRLAEALAAPLSFGRGRAMGWGKAKVSVRPATEGPALHERATRFERAMARRFQLLGLAPPAPGRLIAVTLCAPLLPACGGDGTREIERALGAAVEWILRARRFAPERGWDQQRGAQEGVMAVRAGAVFVARLPVGEHWERHAPQLRRMELHGVGERTWQGFGRVMFFDPFIDEGSRS